MKALLRAISLVAIVLAPVGTSWAIGRVYARIPNSQTSPIYNLRIKSLAATVTIHDQLAVTSVDQEFANDNGMRLEGFYVFTLPAGAQVNEMYLWINGVRTAYTVKKREDAIVKYTEIVSRIADPAILQQLGPNTFQIRIFPFNAYSTRRIEIQYSQPLTYYKGSIQYVFPLDMRDYTSAPIETVSLAIDLQSQLPVVSLQTSADQFPAAVQVTRLTDYHYTIAYGVENVSFSRDFNVRCSIDRSNKSMIALTYTSTEYPQDPPYFLLWTALPDSLYGDSVKTRELTFVADISSSMDGTRIEQLKDALLSFIDLLGENDRFNIIAFSTGIVQFRGDLVTASVSRKDSARAFVTGLNALGLTNFEAALHQSFLQSYSDSVHAAIIFLTDGQPSWGEISPDSLLTFVQRWNANHVRLFPVGVGEEPDYTLLENLAKRTGGLFTRIMADDSIYVEVRDLYRLLFLPRIRNVMVDFGSAGANDVHPTPLPELYAGDQLLTAGRFSHAGTAHVALTGSVGSVPVTVAEDVMFADTNRTWRAVGRYWGAQKIQSILELIKIVGEKPELVSQVISLSIKYSVVTPYTAFLIVEPNTPGSTSVGDKSDLPRQFRLVQNYPNPFNPSTAIRYELPVSVHVVIAVYNTLGQLVAVLVNADEAAGYHEVYFDGAGLSSGVYFYRMMAGSFVETKKFVLAK